jgi:hypothetical protein
LSQQEQKFVHSGESREGMFRAKRSQFGLPKKCNRSLWICRRCFHEQIGLYNERQPEQNSNPATSSSETPLSPIEAFRLRFSQGPTVNPESGPDGTLRSIWDDSPSTDKPELENITLGALAEAYRKSDIRRKYIKRDIWLPDPKQEIDQTTLEGLEEMSDLAEISQLDEMESIAEETEVFAGEMMRDYAGVIPLNGERHVKQKFPVKQGDLVETRGYIYSFYCR